ncbi:MAG: hypothetical protein CL424_09895 [Acidimicrobiaceae bacterium]|nr:hypothetical protein [Acidimicrobiaceae bacterium]
MCVLRTTRCESVDLAPDARRVIAKPFLPRDEIYPDGSSRMEVVLQRILAMPESDVITSLAAAGDDFADRHRDLDATLERNFEIVAARFDRDDLVSQPMSTDRRRLVGAYFTHEYSIEAAALANPSIVAAPDQSGLGPGEVRFVMSLRGIGEGHISSIEFRSGVVAANGDVRIDAVSPFATTGDRTPHAYDKGFFTTRLDDLSLLNEVEQRVLARLEERFTSADLEEAMTAVHADDAQRAVSGEATKVFHWLMSSNYRTSFPASIELSERVLYPSSPTESHGMEDARFVRFVDDDGTVTYYATYTAFDGHQITPQLLETTDFAAFRISTLSGRTAHNKGMAIFPRRIDGRFVALSRHDNVNNYVMTSHDVRVWRESTRIQEPERPWELMQLGNCGSPLETEAGWLVITHGVGPFRRYHLGALLLDLEDPSRVIGHLKEPLLDPADDERDGYVPNVVYSCGAMIHGDRVMLPYGYSDIGTRMVTVGLSELLDSLTRPGR